MASDDTTSIAPPVTGPSGDDSGLSGWRIARVTGAFPTAVSFWMERDDGEATIQILVRQRGETQALQSTRLGDVSYRQFAGIDERKAADVTRAFADGLESGGVPVARYFPHLSTAADVADDRSRLRLAQIMEPAIPLLGDRRQGFNEVSEASHPSKLIFDPPGIAEFIAPEIEVDGEALLGWVFRSVYLPSVARRESADFSMYMLEFTRDDSERTARLTLRVDGSDTKAFGRCGRLSLGIAHDGEIDTVPIEVASLASWVVALLRLRSSAELEIEVPQSLSDLRAILHPPSPDALETRIEGDDDDQTAVVDQGPPPALNLALDPECGQVRLLLGEVVRDADRRRRHRPRRRAHAAAASCTARGRRGPAQRHRPAAALARPRSNRRDPRHGIPRPDRLFDRPTARRPGLSPAVPRASSSAP